MNVDLLISICLLTCLPLTTQTEYNYYTDYDYDLPDFDACNLFANHQPTINGQCHHGSFPRETVAELLGNKVKPCCSSHGYTYIDECAERPEMNNKRVCKQPNDEPPQLLSTILNCPEQCKVITQRFHTQNVQVDQSTGKMTLLNPSDAIKNATIKDFCAAYQCENNDQIWRMSFDVCLCPNIQTLQAVDSKVPQDLPRCCPNSLIASVQDGNITCGSNPGKFCQHHDYTDRKFTTYEIKDSEIVLKRFPSDPEEWKVSRNDHDKYCTALVWQPEHSESLIETEFFGCFPPCNGQKPCIKFCQKASDSEKTFNNDKIKTLFKSKAELETHSDEAVPSERRCKANFHRRYLDPEEDCDHEFDIVKGEDGNFELTNNGKTFNNKEFCLQVQDDESLVAEVCLENHKEHKFTFYPYLLIVSTIFLGLTIIIYTLVPTLLNQLTRLMRHFSTAMLLAFIILIINQLDSSYVATHPGLCSFFGFAQHYFLMVMFALMSTMSIETWIQLKGNTSSDKRYKYQLLFGYTFPIIISLLMIIIEFSASRCNSVRPRIGEKSCFFGSKTATALWFYFPVGALLTFNAVIFGLSIKVVSKLRQELKDAGIIDTGKSKLQENVDKFWTILKLTLGMGMLWFFEIISGLLQDQTHESVWYFFDVINILQGFFIFIIFVCKRSVLDATWKWIEKMKNRDQFANDQLMTEMDQNAATRLSSGDNNAA